MVVLCFGFGFLFVCLGGPTGPVGSHFPDQGVNPSHGSESPEPYPLGPWGTPQQGLYLRVCF